MRRTLKRVLKRLLTLPVVVPLMLLAAVGYLIHEMCNTFVDPLIDWTDK
jgi:hypothetical protein